MQVDRVSAPAPTPSDIYRAYVSVLPKWLRRFSVPGADVADLMQEVWLAVCSGSVHMPQDIRDARLELFKVTRVAAVRLRRRHQREAYRLVSELDDNAHEFDVPLGRSAPRSSDSASEEELAVRALVVFEAFNRLSPKYQQLAREYYVLGYTIKEMAAHADVPEDRMEKWVWRVRAELEKLAKNNKRLEERNTKRQRGLLLVPFAFDLDSATRAAFCSIWEAEGKSNEIGGGGTQPPSAPNRPVFPVAPILSGITGAIVAAVGLALLILMLLLFPVSLVALEYLWKPPPVGTAQTGLRVPPGPNVGVIEDVVPIYPPILPATPRAPAIVSPPARIVHTPLDKTVHGASNGLPSERLAGD